MPDPHRLNVEAGAGMSVETDTETSENTGAETGTETRRSEKSRKKDGPRVMRSVRNAPYRDSIFRYPREYFPREFPAGKSDSMESGRKMVFRPSQQTILVT